VMMMKEGVAYIETQHAQKNNSHEKKFREEIRVVVGIVLTHT
jgi:hypothetical protein